MLPALHLDRASDVPLQKQIYLQLRDGILHGAIPVGAKLPPTRTLAEQCQVARMTVVDAYRQLHEEGYVTSRTGAGTFVRTDLPSPDHSARQYEARLAPWGRRVMERPTAASQGENRLGASGGIIDFRFGRSFPHIFPYDVWRRLLARYLSTDDAMLSRYGSVAGFEPLRTAVAGYLNHERGVVCGPEQVIIVNGAQQALDLLGRLLLRSDDAVLVETPGYTDAYEIFTLQGARLIPLPVDAHGAMVELIPPNLSARLAFVTPSNQFPGGGTMPAQRRLDLLAWAQRADALVIEDDYDGELRYESHPVAAMQGMDSEGRVLYLGTFSKVLFPALRLGYIVLPPGFIEPFLQAKRIVDRGAPTLTQAAVADFIAEGHFQRHLRRLRRAYGRRRQVLIEELQRRLPETIRFSHEPAGLHIMLYLPPDWSENNAIQAAAAAGVRVYPGRTYYLNEPAPPSVLLGYTGLSEEQIREGILRLANAWDTPPFAARK